MKIPIISAENLWHWGDLDIRNRYRNGRSLEGNLFSMSACPDAWCQIARLGGSSLHVRNEPSQLLDMLSVLYGKDRASAGLRQIVETWAAKAGLVEMRDVYRIESFDDESESTYFTEYLDLAEATLEADEDQEIISVVKLVGTSRLAKIHNLSERDIVGFEYALIDWAKETLSAHIQGVYWSETLDPECYSAPRAGMFDSQSLNLKPAAYIPDDEDGLLSIGETQWITLNGLEPKDAEPMP